jgi:hypothetical protein
MTQAKRERQRESDSPDERRILRPEKVSDVEPKVRSPHAAALLKLAGQPLIMII